VTKEAYNPLRERRFAPQEQVVNRERQYPNAVGNPRPSVRGGCQRLLVFCAIYRAKRQYTQTYYLIVRKHTTHGYSRLITYSVYCKYRTGRRELSHNNSRTTDRKGELAVGETYRVAILTRSEQTNKSSTTTETAHSKDRSTSDSESVSPQSKKVRLGKLRSKISAIKATGLPKSIVAMFSSFQTRISEIESLWRSRQSEKMLRSPPLSTPLLEDSESFLRRLLVQPQT